MQDFKIEQTKVGGPERFVTINYRADTLEPTFINEIWADRYYFKNMIDIKPGDIVIDVGAHIGMFSLLAAFCGARKVYAYEPEPNNFDMLKKNIHENGYDDVIIPINKAVSDKKGKLTLQYHLGMLKNTGKLSTHYLGGDEAQITVPSVRLDDELLKIGTCNFLKMDCEGAEYDIFKGMNQISLEKIGRIVMEWHNSTRDAIGLAKEITDVCPDLVLVELFGVRTQGRMSFVNKTHPINSIFF